MGREEESWTTRTDRSAHASLVKAIAGLASSKTLVSEEQANLVLDFMRQEGRIYLDFIERAKSSDLIKRWEGNFQAFFDQLPIGQNEYILRKSDTGPALTICKKLDGSVSLSSEIEAHERFKRFCKQHFPDAVFLSEEHSEAEMAKVLADAKANPNAVIIPVDTLDNTRGYCLRMFGQLDPRCEAFYPAGRKITNGFLHAHQYSINIAVSDPNGEQGFGCFALPESSRIYYNIGDQVFMMDQAYSPTNREPMTIELNLNHLRGELPDKIIAVTSHGANSPFKTPEQRERAQERDGKLIADISGTGKSVELIYGTGIRRIALVLRGDAHVAVSGAGMHWWDVKCAFEIFRAAGLAVGIDPEDRGKVPPFPSDEKLPQLYFSSPEILKAMGKEIICSQHVDTAPESPGFRPSKVAPNGKA